MTSSPKKLPKRSPRRELERLAAGIRVCPACRLSDSRTHAVPGEGPVEAKVFFVGEAPGRKEDESGRPFVGPSGRLLDSLLARIGLSRAEVFITGTVKCRPPRNRPPRADEIATCSRLWLFPQLATVRPRLIVCLGQVGLQAFRPDLRVSAVHGQTLQVDGRTIFVTFHPAAAMRFPKIRKLMEQDFAELSRLLSRV